MTKKHFIQFAAIIKQRVEEAGKDKELRGRAAAIALAVIEVAEKDNSKFNRAKFWEACGL
jgi:hypothetical protein